ncbi:transcription factor MYB [Pycnococcus provasolii]
MGAPKVKWAHEEEDALREGVRKYGQGKWRAIQKDPEFSRHLVNRTNVDLKDKWRNLSAAAQEGRTTLPELPANPAPVPKSPRGKRAADGAASGAGGEPTHPVPPLASQKPKKVRYEDMVVQAVTELGSTDEGVSAQGVAKWIEEYHEVPNNFRKTLNTHLTNLVATGKLVKMGANNAHYKLGDGTPPQPGPVAPANKGSAGAGAGAAGSASKSAGASGPNASTPAVPPPPPAAPAPPPPAPSAAAGAAAAAAGAGVASAAAGAGAAANAAPPPAPPPAIPLPPKKKAKLAAQTGKVSKPPRMSDPKSVHAAEMALGREEREYSQLTAEMSDTWRLQKKAQEEADELLRQAQEAEERERRHRAQFASRPPKKRPAAAEEVR